MREIETDFQAKTVKAIEYYNQKQWVKCLAVYRSLGSAVDRYFNSDEKKISSAIKKQFEWKMGVATGILESDIQLTNYLVTELSKISNPRLELVVTVPLYGNRKSIQSIVNDISSIEVEMKAQATKVKEILRDASYQLKQQKIQQEDYNVLDDMSSHLMTADYTVKEKAVSVSVKRCRDWRSWVLADVYAKIARAEESIDKKLKYFLIAGRFLRYCLKLFGGYKFEKKGEKANKKLLFEMTAEIAHEFYDACLGSQIKMEQIDFRQLRQMIRAAFFALTKKNKASISAQHEEVMYFFERACLCCEKIQQDGASACVYGIIKDYRLQYELGFDDQRGGERKEGTVDNYYKAADYMASLSIIGDFYHKHSPASLIKGGVNNMPVPGAEKKSPGVSGQVSLEAGNDLHSFASQLKASVTKQGGPIGVRSQVNLNGASKVGGSTNAFTRSSTKGGVADGMLHVDTTTVDRNESLAPSTVRLSINPSRKRKRGFAVTGKNATALDITETTKKQKCSSVDSLSLSSKTLMDDCWGKFVEVYQEGLDDQRNVAHLRKINFPGRAGAPSVCLSPQGAQEMSSILCVAQRAITGLLNQQSTGLKQGDVFRLNITIHIIKYRRSILQNEVNCDGLLKPRRGKNNSRLLTDQPMSLFKSFKKSMLSCGEKSARVMYSIFEKSWKFDRENLVIMKNKNFSVPRKESSIFIDELAVDIAFLPEEMQKNILMNCIKIFCQSRKLTSGEYDVIRQRVLSPTQSTSLESEGYLPALSSSSGH